MNIHNPNPATPSPTQEDAERALATLREWAAARRTEVGGYPTAAGEHSETGAEGTPYPTLSREYPEAFRASADYRATLPDLQNGPENLIRGAHLRIQQVGISNFRLPLRMAKRGGSTVTLETSVTGTVSLEAEQKGINMSRIMRSFYAVADDNGGWEIADAVLDAYKRDLGSFDARLMLRFSYPLEMPSLRSDLSGWQYYDVALEVVEQAGERSRILHLDYVYSSTCPCSLELSEHARQRRGQLATPHSQRSVARLSMLLDASAPEMTVEDIVEACRAVIPTETQVMVKREDEQAFAELNAANPIFVEDAARLFAQALMADARVGDFRVIASHQESLHSHDAISILTGGPTFAETSQDPHLFSTLIHRG